MKKILIAAALVALVATQAPADTFQITMYAEHLRLANGDLMPTSGLVMLVASTLDSTFSGPTPTAFVQDDDIILKKWDLTVENTPGLFFDTTGVLDYHPIIPNLTVGDPLALYWFPTLTLSSTEPGWGTQYGFFTTNAVLEFSDMPWSVPAYGNWNLTILTESAGGSLPDDAGKALFATPIPEPSTALLVGMAMAGFWIIRRRNRK